MDISLEVIVFFVLLFDAIGANVIAWSNREWYRTHFAIISRYFPATKGWTTYYLILVLWMGYLLVKFGAF